MKHFSLLCRLMLICLFCLISMSAFSQGVAIYKKNGAMVKFAYEEIDSIVTYNYGETPGVPVTPPTAPQCEAVDLGLSVKWASFNVGATKPEEYGGYYAWGETEEKESYFEENYLYYNNGSYTNIGNDISGTQYDVAHVKWGGDWRMPTFAEQQELIDNCTWELTTVNGVYGYKVTGSNGNSIFLPAAGCRYESEIDDVGNAGYYFSSTMSDELSVIIYFDDGDKMLYSNYSFYGHSVRPVCE